MNKIVFRRNTHDKNGDYRGDKYFGYKSSWDGCIDKEIKSLGVHAWAGSGQDLTLEEIINVNRIHHEEYGCPNVQVYEILNDLIVMIKRRLILVIES